MSVSVYNTVLIHVSVFIPFFALWMLANFCLGRQFFSTSRRIKTLHLIDLKYRKREIRKNDVSNDFSTFGCQYLCVSISFLVLRKTLFSDTNSNSMISSMIHKFKILIDQTMKCIMPMIMSGTTSAPSRWPTYSS